MIKNKLITNRRNKQEIHDQQANTDRLEGINGDAHALRPCKHWAPDAHDDGKDGGAAGLQVNEEAGVRTAPPSHTCAAGGR